MNKTVKISARPHNVYTRDKSGQLKVFGKAENYHILRDCKHYIQTIAQDKDGNKFEHFYGSEYDVAVTARELIKALAYTPNGGAYLAGLGTTKGGIGSLRDEISHAATSWKARFRP